ncbi:EAL domain-containing protein [Actinoplanes oblitus]|uniref:EAL domain-containing protein n=1 Tax=Actinoplanes oblitus TaxID=3040509 RepID=A0ABY8W6K7_9ACTN|nr:EAL domain-containing protein [Actinoplanes oblitus]WIM93469.1 EAL domain-containing protein [Actinoplanes oblitus]
MAGTAGIALLGVLWWFWWSATRVGPAAVAYVFMPAGGVVAAFAIVDMTRHVRLAPAARRFWRWLLIGSLLLSIGYLALSVAAFRSSPAYPEMPIVATVCVSAGVLAAIFAVVRVPLGVTSRYELGRQWLDRSIAFLGCAAVLYHFGLAPLIDARGVRDVPLTVTILLAFLLAAGSITKVSYIVGGPVDRVAVRLLAAMGMVGAVVAVIAVKRSPDWSAVVQAAVLPVVPALTALAAHRQRISTGAPPRRPNTWLPYLAVAAVQVPVVDVLLRPASTPARAVAAVSVTVIALVTVRQYVVIRENTRLLLERQESERRLRYEATHDPLTGLANRAFCHEWLASALGRGDATMLLVDLDDFKTVNDSLGHHIGDELLVAFAESLRGAVGDAGRVVRLGGDEFAVLMTGPGGGDAIAQRIMSTLERPISANRLLVHASMGLATAPAGSAVGSLLRDADIALLTAKQRGKGNWVRYTPGMDRPVFADAQLGGDLRRALDAGEFRLLYQPIVRLADRRLIGVEALVRWHHPERGLVPPLAFIPAAERTGLIVPLGRFVLRETCRQAAAWLAEFGTGALQKASPNVSVRQLHDPDFVDDVRAALADSGLPPDRLVLELTESAVLRGPRVSQVLHEVHGLGVRLALDDFGTGESSLSLLRAFPVAMVKLDKSFVDGIELGEPGTVETDARQAVARAVGHLADALRLETVAEGIENEDQVRQLRRLGYTVGQGYHLGRPMEAAQITALLAEQAKAAAAA